MARNAATTVWPPVRAAASAPGLAGSEPAASADPAAIATLARDAAVVVILLERFGDLLADALDAAGRGADEELAVAVGERTRVTAALGNRLAALAITRQVARRHGATTTQITATLRPVDDALYHAQLLHDRVTDNEDGAGATRARGTAALTLVR